MTALVGQVGTVTVRLRGGEAPGEVRLSYDGIPDHFIAFCREAVPVGGSVLVIGDRGSRAVDVVPWVDPTRG